MKDREKNITRIYIRRAIHEIETAQRSTTLRAFSAFSSGGGVVERNIEIDDDRHGFIASAREGLDVFATIDPEAPLVVAEAVWQYSNHVLPGLSTHSGPILTVANWSGQWPGLEIGRAHV